jgi:hypothetical protein
MNDFKKGPDKSGPFLDLAMFYIIALSITNFHYQEFQIMRVLHTPDNRVVT